MFHSRFKPLLYGVLALMGLIGVATLVWAAMPSNAPVVYTGTDLVAMPAGTTFSAQILNALAPFTASQSLTAQQAINLTGVITPAQITATQNDYSPTGLSTAFAVRISTNASQTLTGLATGGLGRLLIMENVGTQNAVLAAEHTSSTASNRFDFPGDLTLIPKSMVLLKYDNTAPNPRWRASFPTLPIGPVSASLLLLAQQTGDPSPIGGTWQLYAKSTGVHARDPGGNIVGPFGTGSGGGGASTTEKLPVQAATTGDITLSNPGTAIFDGVTLTAGQRLLVRQQSTGSQNGLYLFATSSTALTRATDADTSGEFIDAFSVKVQSGTLYGGVTFYFANVGAFTLGTTTPNFAVQSWGAKGETSAARSTVTTSVANGTIGSDANGRIPWNRDGSYAVHMELSATSQITPASQTIGIQNSGEGNVLLTSGDPRILGCSAAADGIHIYLVGLSITKTVTLPDGNGILLAGALGSGAGAPGGVTIGMAPGGTSAEFRCNGGTSTWEQVSYTTLQQAKNAGASITNAEIEASGVRLGGASDYCVHYGATQKCYCSGVPCLNTTIGPLPSTGKFRVLNNASAEIFSVAENGTVTGLTAGAAVLTGNAGNDNVPCSSGGDISYGAIAGRTITTPGGNEGDVAARTPRTGTVAKLYVQFADVVPDGQTADFVIRKNLSSSAVTCSVTGGSGVGTGEIGTTTDLQCNDTTHTVAVTAGTDRLNLEFTCSGGTTSLPAFNYAFVIE